MGIKSESGIWHTLFLLLVLSQGDGGGEGENTDSGGRELGCRTMINVLDCPGSKIRTCHLKLDGIMWVSEHE